MAGFIIVNHEYDLRGNLVRRDYEWEGDTITSIDINFIDGEPKPGNVIEIGPYLVKIMEWEIWSNNVKVIRIDKSFWWLRYFWHRYNRSFDLAYRRFIITLAVWNLAVYDPATIPDWTDIKLIKRLRGKLDR